MSVFTLQRADVKVMFWHLALYGLATICEDAGAEDISIGWSAGVTPRPWLRIADQGVGDQLALLAGIVHSHARHRAEEPSWLLRDIEIKGTQRGLMSPRLSTFPHGDAWEAVQEARHRELDRLTEQHAWLDLRLLAALGEPCYWRHNRQQQPLQDEAASRLEMQPRNQGSEFVGNRLRKLAQHVAARDVEGVASGLSGRTVIDECGKDAVDSRTPTGLASPGPVDNALAWCALWGISQFPLAMRAGATAVTSGHVGRGRQEWFYLPFWTGSWRPARMRSILASGQLRAAAAADLPRTQGHDRPTPWAVSDTEATAARQWLRRRGVEGVVRFPVVRFGSDSAPERRAMRGERVGVR